VIIVCSVCPAHAAPNEGISVVYLLAILLFFFNLAIRGLSFSLTRIFCCFTVLLLVGLEHTSWEVQPHLVFRLSFSDTILRFIGLAHATSSLFFDWLWWQGLWSSNPYSQPLCMRPCLLFVPNQHAIMCRMPVGMVDKSPHGGWLFTYMMRILSSSSAAWFAFFMYWGSPLILALSTSGKAAYPEA